MLFVDTLKVDFILRFVVLVLHLVSMQLNKLSKSFGLLLLFVFVFSTLFALALSWFSAFVVARLVVSVAQKTSFGALFGACNLDEQQVSVGFGLLIC